jgi:Leucine-rich repeat (LRR) protein
MTSPKVFFRLLILHHVTFCVATWPANPVFNCRHNFDKTSWNCSYAEFLDIPAGSTFGLPVFTNIHDLDLSHNAISTVKSFDFRISDQLLLGDNHIIRIEDEAFSNLTDLNILDLSNNRLRGLIGFNAKTFVGLNNLLSLSLQGNPLGVVRDEVFLFSNLANLTTLNLSHCDISVIGEHAIQLLGQLTSLDLSWNVMTSLPAEVFDGLIRLRSLNLQHNQILIIGEEFGNLISLKYLLLNHNNIVLVKDSTFIPPMQAKALTLSTLSLANNKLTQIPFVALSSLNFIHTLDISGNPVKELSNPGLPVNFTIYVGNIRIIGNMPHMTSIQARGFSPFRNLSSVSITDNPVLVDIDKNAFIGATDSIDSVWMTNNAITTLHHGVLPWRRMNHVRLDGLWLCDCRLYWMTQILDHRNLSLM